MWLAVLIGISAAEAVTPDALETRLAGIDSLRSMREAEGAPSISSSEVRRAAGGTIVTGLEQVQGSPAAKAYGVAVLDVSISLLWAAINDETRHPGYTAVTYSELLHGRPCVSGRRVLQSLDAPMVGTRWWIGLPRSNDDLAQRSGGAVRELVFSSTVDTDLVTSESGRAIISSATPIGSSDGAWFLVALDSRHTYVEYYVQTDPGGRVSPRLASMFASRGVRGTITAIRKFAREGNPSCPIE